MNSALNRTADWARLSGSRIARVVDRPGEITVSRAPRHLRRMLVMLAAVWAIQLLCFREVDLISIVWAVVFTGVMTLALVPGILSAMGYASRVRLTPDRLEFWNGVGLPMGHLWRDGMQQIAVEQGERGLIFHRFISDTGYMSTFADNRPTEALLFNNILMAAFAQPLELDLMPVTYAPGAVADAPLFDAPAFNVTGARRGLPS